MSIRLKKAYIPLYLTVLMVAALVAAFIYISVLLSTAAHEASVRNSMPFPRVDITRLIYCFIAVFVIIAGLTVLTIYCTGRLHKRAIYANNQLGTYRNEIEKLSKYMDNLTNLYNSTLEYNAQKTEFFSNISHELKTPLSVILGAVQLLDHQKDPLSPERRKSAKNIGIIKHNSYRLLKLVNNLLDLTRIDAGYAKVNMVCCNIVYIAEEITQSVLPFAQQKNLTLEFDTDSEEIYTAVDIEKMDRVILNLLSNAVKFTGPGGKITVRVWEDDSMVKISVKDTGSGIPRDMIESIFERFKQVNSPLTRENEGTGIGLSIVKSFIELHRGTIEVKSEEGKGAEFILHIPIVVCQEENEHAVLPSKKVQNKIIEAINVELSDTYFASL